MIFLGVDIGTTRTKVLLYDAETGERRVVARPTPVTTSADGDLRDADETLAAVVDGIGEVVSALSSAERARITGIGVTSLSEEMVLLDTAGASLGPMPTWYNQSLGGAAAAAAGLDPSFSWAKLHWAFERIAGSASQPFGDVGPAEVATVTTLNGYVADRLAAAGRFAVDHSHASRTGFFDVRTAQWHPEVFRRTGWPESLLPDLVPTATSIGVLASGLAGQWGLPDSVRITLAGHDHFCGAYGIGVRGDGELYVSAGTSEAHCLIVDRLPDGPLPADVGAGRFVDGTRFYLHRQLPSGHLYRHWRRLLGLEQETAEQEATAIAARPIGSDGAVLVPGFGTDTRSWLLGVPADADEHTILRALFEGLASAALHVDRALTGISGAEVTAVLAAGVPCQSPAWQQVRAHLTDAPLSISHEAEAPALGAALIAQSAVSGTPAPVQPSTLVDPDPALLPAYRSVYDRFERALSGVAG